MKIKRRFTTKEGGPYAEVDFHTVTSEIRNPNGSVVFKNDAVEVPSDWSQVASDIIAQKYFRKAGVPSVSRPVREDAVPEWLWSCLLYTSPSPRDGLLSRMPSSA